MIAFESLTPMNEPIAFNYRKLKRKDLNCSSCNKNGVINIRITAKSQPVKIFHIERLNNLFSDFDFKDGEMYKDASHDADTSVHLTY